MDIRSWVVGIKYIVLLSIILIIFWLILFIWFYIEEQKYGDDIVDKSGFTRTYYEINKDGKNIKKYYGNAFIDSSYFVSTIFGAFGYGDIYPRTNAAKSIITIMHFIIIIFTLNLLEHVFVSEYTNKDLAINIIKLENENKTLKKTCSSNKNFEYNPT